jgi:hypothetical protein
MTRFKVYIKAKASGQQFSDDFYTKIEAKDLPSAFAKAVTIAKTLDVVEKENFSNARSFWVYEVEEATL